MMRNVSVILFLALSCYGLSQSTPTIKIGTQTWCKLNLNVGKFANGEAIPQAKNQAEWKSAGEQGKPAWCYYDFSSEQGKKYGRLYNWYAVNDPRGLAPKGFAVPASQDWQQLVDFCGGITLAGKKLKAASGWDQSGNGSESNGFNGLPGGFVLNDGLFSGKGATGGWWTSTEGDEGSAAVFYLESEKSTVETYNDFKVTGFSVRLMKK